MHAHWKIKDCDGAWWVFRREGPGVLSWGRAGSFNSLVEAERAVREWSATNHDDTARYYDEFGRC
jgi:hypothetical protein